MLKTNQLITCKCCGSKDAEDYVDIYKPVEPIQVDYWLCTDCYSNTTFGMNSEEE